MIQICVSFTSNIVRLRLYNTLRQYISIGLVPTAKLELNFEQHMSGCKGSQVLACPKGQAVAMIVILCKVILVIPQNFTAYSISVI